jgi:mRNA-degrading endonuclease RelE of RelBE toxin-antitoxin system
MNKIDKYLKKLNPKDRASIIEILEQITSGDISGLDIKKLKGYDNYFRVRKGKTRIIFHLDINGLPIIERIERRSDTTY